MIYSSKENRSTKSVTVEQKCRTHVQESFPTTQKYLRVQTAQSTSAEIQTVVMLLRGDTAAVITGTDEKPYSSFLFVFDL